MAEMCILILKWAYFPHSAPLTQAGVRNEDGEDLNRLIAAAATSSG
jgi:hypothetical protein